LYAVGVSADQLPVYKAVVVVLIVVFQSPAFKKWMAQRKLKAANTSLATVTAK
jgi:simple sugar transport system permease protein